MRMVTLRLNEKQYQQLAHLSRANACKSRSDYLRLLIDQEASQTKLKASKNISIDANANALLLEKLKSVTTENLILTKFLVLSKNQTVSDEDLKRVIELARSNKE